MNEHHHKLSLFDCFDQTLIINTLDGSFNVYIAGEANYKNCVLFLFHGFQHTGASWSLFARYMKDKVCLVAPDFRGHGYSTTTNDGQLDIGTLVSDMVNVIKAFLDRCNTKMSLESPENHTDIKVVLVGHSLGGAVATRVANTEEINLSGLVLVDSSEVGLSALDLVEEMLMCIPQSFESIDEAIDWMFHNHRIRNLESSSISVPTQFKEENGFFVWKPSLQSTMEFWEGWFRGLSKDFLRVRCPKVFMCAGMDRLDKELTIGQIQGKFELRLIYGCGHFIHEDLPAETADCLTHFLVRNNIIQLITTTTTTTTTT